MRKALIPLTLLGFGVTMAVIIGQRMSTDAMAVVIGVAVGVVTSIPTSLLLVAMLRREHAMRSDAYPAATPPPPGWGNSPYGQLPPPNFIVIDPTQYAQNRLAGGYPLPPPRDGQQPDGGARSLRVIGSDDDWN